MEGLRKEPMQYTPTKKKRMHWLGLGVAGAAVVALSFAVGFVANERNWLDPYAVTTSENGALPDDLNYESVEEVYDTLRRKYDGVLSEAELIDGIKQGLAEASGDPYTSYFNVEDTKAFYDTLNGSFEGIGAELGIENDVLVVVAPLEGFPAQKAGLRAGDIIAKIDEHDSLHMTVEEAVSKIRGEKGTQVTLTIVRDGKEQEIKITRDTITVPSVEHEMLAGNVGRITVSRFAEDTGDLARSAANTLKKDGAKAIILDLRNNSGGYVDAGVSVASLWLDEGKTVFEQRSGGRTVETSQASGDAVLKGLPTIVLINEGSASASEIVAGALKDNGVAELLGVKSFGKGSVQRLEELSDGSTLKVTIARWFTPNGVNIDQDGIVPDVEVTISDEDIQAKRDPQLDAASKKLVQQ